MVVIFGVGCSGPVIVDVDTGTYEALVPSAEQFAADLSNDIPGGFAFLRDADIDSVILLIEDDEVSFMIDGIAVATREVSERREVRDKEGSGPLKGSKSVLILGEDPLVIDGLSIDQPVVWPGSFEGSPVITVKPWNPNEHGPAISCSAVEHCLLLSAGVQPSGRYENVNDPEQNQSPITSIYVTDEFIEFTFPAEQKVRFSRTGELSNWVCGLSETVMWDVPAEVGLGMRDPVLVHTVCPSAPGSSIQLVIMERAEIPLLAPLSNTADGNWCTGGPACLWFAPA